MVGRRGAIAGGVAVITGGLVGTGLTLRRLGSPSDGSDLLERYQVVHTHFTHAEDPSRRNRRGLYEDATVSFHETYRQARGGDELASRIAQACAHGIVNAGCKYNFLAYGALHFTDESVVVDGTALEPPDARYTDTTIHDSLLRWETATPVPAPTDLENGVPPTDKYADVAVEQRMPDTTGAVECEGSPDEPDQETAQSYRTGLRTLTGGAVRRHSGRTLAEYGDYRLAEIELVQGLEYLVSSMKAFQTVAADLEGSGCAFGQAAVAYAEALHGSVDHARLATRALQNGDTATAQSHQSDAAEIEADLWETTLPSLDRVVDHLGVDHPGHSA